jgi:predicted transcriptional regulator
VRLNAHLPDYHHPVPSQRRFQPDDETLRALRDRDVTASAIAAEHGVHRTSVSRYLASDAGKRRLRDLDRRLRDAERQRQRRAAARIEANRRGMGLEHGYLPSGYEAREQPRERTWAERFRALNDMSPPHAVPRAVRADRLHRAGPNALVRMEKGRSRSWVEPARVEARLADGWILAEATAA